MVVHFCERTPRVSIGYHERRNEKEKENGETCHALVWSSLINLPGRWRRSDGPMDQLTNGEGEGEGEEAKYTVNPYNQ
jgi:hypothetical protein